MIGSLYSKSLVVCSKTKKAETTFMLNPLVLCLSYRRKECVNSVAWVEYPFVVFLLVEPN